MALGVEGWTGVGVRLGFSVPLDPPLLCEYDLSFADAQGLRTDREVTLSQPCTPDEAE
jgi:hypothetical protein